MSKRSRISQGAARLRSLVRVAKPSDPIYRDGIKMTAVRKPGSKGTAYNNPRFYEEWVMHDMCQYAVYGRSWWPENPPDDAVPLEEQSQ